MTIIDAIKHTDSFITREKHYDFISEFARFFHLSVSISLLDDSTIDGDEILIILDGQAAEKIDRALDYGFQINSKGEGSIYLPSGKYLYSFAKYIFSDLIKLQLKDSVFIPFKPAFKQLRTAYDYFLTQEGRVTSDLSREKYIDRLAVQGVTDMEVNGLGYPMGLENGIKGETYPMFYTYCPAMDQFVYSSLNKGLYPLYYLSQNLNNLKQNAEWATSRGLKPGMLSFEPRSVPEAFFQRYPMLRGARVDHPFRSFTPRYNMTITHPVVLNHYWEMTQKLLQAVPDLSFLTIWTNDSGAGFEHTKSLYVGRNGGAYLIREWKDDETIAKLAAENAIQFMNNILEAGREINPDFRVITRLESFYGEHEEIWKGLGNGIDVETTSLVAKGWNMPYRHTKYSDSSVINGGGLHHQDFYPEEKEKYDELKEKDCRASFYFGVGPQVMFAPLMGIPYPKSVWSRLKKLHEAAIGDIVVYGGTFPPDKVPYFINYDLIRRFQYEPNANPESIIFELAENYTKGFFTEELINAWNLIEDAALNFPNVSTLYNTIGFTWYRLWVRPLIPNLDEVSGNERAYYEDMMCTTPHNPNNVDLAKDVLFQIASIEHCTEAIGLIDHDVLPNIHRAIKILGSVTEKNPDPSGVFTDQLIRAKALLCYLTTHRNIAAWISYVHKYMESSDSEEKQFLKESLTDMIENEISNMDALHDLFDQEVEFIALMDTGESPLMYGKNIQSLLRKKQDLMRKYKNSEPYIDPDYMMKKAGTLLV